VSHIGGPLIVAMTEPYADDPTTPAGMTEAHRDPRWASVVVSDTFRWAVLRTRQGLKWCGSRLAAEGPYPLATSGYPLATDGAVWIHPLTSGFYFSV